MTTESTKGGAEEFSANVVANEPSVEAQAKGKDSFISGMPTDLTLPDCIVDKTKYESIADQRQGFEKTMREMTRLDKDEENGWALFGRTNVHKIAEEDQLDVYAREVPWSAVKQLRSSLNARCKVIDAWRHLHTWQAFKDVQKSVSHPTSSNPAKLTKSVNEAAKGENVHKVFKLMDEKSRTSIVYRVVPFPWPLTHRDLFFVQEYVYRKSHVKG